MSISELQEFAERVGISSRAFQGDHYDIPEEHRAVVVGHGAIEVNSRELLRRLKASGLRLSTAQRRERAGVNVAPNAVETPPIP